MELTLWPGVDIEKPIAPFQVSFTATSTHYWWFIAIVTSFAMHMTHRDNAT
jgi:hypothetical protein